MVAVGVVGVAPWARGAEALAAGTGAADVDVVGGGGGWVERNDGSRERNAEYDGAAEPVGASAARASQNDEKVEDDTRSGRED